MTERDETERLALKRADDEARRVLLERLGIVVGLQVTILVAVLGRYLLS